MKRKRIHLEDSLNDREEFKPHLLITLDNQCPTQQLFGPTPNQHTPFYGSSSQTTPFPQSPSPPTCSPHQQSKPRLLTSHSHLQSLNSRRFYSEQAPRFQNLQTEDGLSGKNTRLSSSDGLMISLQRPESRKFRRSRLVKKYQDLKESGTNEHSQPGMFANTSYLNSVLKQERTKNITRNFIKKVRRRKVDDRFILDLEQEESTPSIFSVNGIEIHENAAYTLRILQVLFTLILVFVDSIQLVFDGVLSQEIFVFKICALAFYVVQFLTTMVTVKMVSGRRFEELNEIWQYLGPEKIGLDLMSILVIVADVSFAGAKVMAFVRLFVVVKVPQLWKNLQQVEIKLINSNQYEKYWSLVKVLLFNFCFAHILAITLTAMVEINPQQNWMTVKDIFHAEWFEKYVWSYYWGTNIMLTVGFGDIAASNYKEAICLIFIETFSCIVLAYNVNCVGELIMNIRSKDDEKKKQIKLFKKITESCEISNDLNWKITNYIEESINLRKNFNFEEEYRFIGNLPRYLKYDFLKQTHKTVFNSLPFFRFMMEKTVYNLAEKIEMRMSHPEEIIHNKADDFNLWIMRSGQVGLACSRSGSDLNNLIMDRITLGENAQPFLLSLSFITKQQLPYEFKSLEYSSFYFMEFGKLIDCLRQNESDFQYYAFMRDKIRNIPDEFEVMKCPTCTDRFHFKFNCPAIHHLPNKDKIIFSHLRAVKFGKNTQRRKHLRDNQTPHALAIYRYYKQDKPQRENSEFGQYPTSLMGEETTLPRCYQRQTLVLEEDLGTAETQGVAVHLNQFNDNFKDLKEFFIGQLEKARYEDGESDPIWLLKSDVMMDYSKYFQQDNPNALAGKVESMKARRRSRAK